MLIVEDQPDLRALIKDNLESHFQVLEASNGLEGEQLALKYIPDLIVSDVMMPKKDGFELCKTLKKENKTNHIPIILLTARAELNDKLHGLEIGADDYLPKPFDQKELTIRIQNLINNRKLSQNKVIQKTELVVFKPTEVSQDGTDQAFLEKIT